METEDSKDLQLKEQLNLLCKLNLFRNTKKEFGDYIGYDLTKNNGITKIPPSKARILYRDISMQIKEELKEIDIDEILSSYEKASEIFMQIKKVCTKIKDDSLYSLLRGLYIEDQIFPENDKDIQRILTILQEKELYYDAYTHSLLILLIKKILPLPTTKNKEVKNINNDFSHLYHFLYNFIETIPSIRNILAISMEYQNNTFKDLDSVKKNRLFLIQMCRITLGNIIAHANNNGHKIMQLVKEISKTFKIDNCYWSDNSKHDTTTFWRFEQTIAKYNYLLYRFHFSTKRKEIYNTIYETIFYDNLGTIYVNINTHRLSNEILEKEFSATFKGQISIYKCNIDNNISPSKIELLEDMLGTYIVDFRKLFKLEDKDRTEQLNDWLEGKDGFKFIDDPNIREHIPAKIDSIHKDSLIIEVPNKDESLLRYRIKSDKKIKEQLENVTIDMVTIIATIKNKKYIIIEPLDFRLNIEKGIQEGLIEIVDKITP